MTERTNHPDFEAAPPEHRWTRSLRELKAELRAGAFRARGGWVWYALPGGAVVSMRCDETAFPRRELRIARRNAPKDDAARAAWQREIDTFRRYLGAEAWVVQETRAESDRGGLGIEVTMLESFEKPAPTCGRCGRPAEPGPYKELLCNVCALAAGAEEIASRQGKGP